MRQVLGALHDFKNEKSHIEERGYIHLFLPKFHPELNPIEQVWAQAKRHTKAYCKYTVSSLRRHYPLDFESVTNENIKNYYRKVRHYMMAYLLRQVGGLSLEQTGKFYKKAVKSSRWVSVNQ